MWLAMLMLAASSAPAQTSGDRTAPPPPPFMGDKLTTDQLKVHRGQPGVVRLSWVTQSEEDNFGFNVMRGTNKDGKNFKPINKKPILGAGTSSTENVYVYYDKDVKVGDYYYYFIQEISVNNQTRDISPVLGRQVVYLYHKDKDKASDRISNAPAGADHGAAPSGASRKK